MESKKHEEKGFFVWEETFAFLKVKSPYLDAFACIRDRNETTLIVEQEKLGDLKEDIIEMETGFKLITFDMKMPFSLTGFIAKISKLLAENEIPVAVISSYSTDHLFVKQEDIKDAIETIKQAGFILK